jgi:hypothetical protein
MNKNLPARPPTSLIAALRLAGLLSVLTGVIVLAFVWPTATSSARTTGGLAAALFPLVIGGMIGGVLISVRLVGIRARLLALFVYAVIAGCVLAAILQLLFGLLEGALLLNAIALGLSVLGTGSLIVGLTAVLGARGVIVGAVITILIANPLAGNTVPRELIAAPWGDVGQFAVPGAAFSLLKGLSDLPDAPHLTQWVILCVWTACGILLSLVGHNRARRRQPGEI